ncbi:MAG: hypothetical protein GC151_13745 [Betaproteobacteria bacterium]|nr:hypothetical protein [Betaproteobacteria bacterium]
MKLTCPCCGYVGEPEGYLSDVQWRDALSAALKLPAPLGDRLVRYVGLFRPRQRALSPDRAARILLELLEPISEARVERNGRSWPAPFEYWSSALDDMLSRRDTLQLPLKSHGYLFEIVAGIANKAEGRAETKREEGRAYPYSTTRSTDPEQIQKRAEMPAEFRDLVKRLRGGPRDDADKA